MQITSFNNAHDRSVFYEKQSNQIFISVNEKIMEQEQGINQKKQTLDLLRLENHDIYDKQRQIKVLITQLSEELKQVSLINKEQKLLNKMQVQNQSRIAQIDNYMQIVNKQTEIENDINTLKDSQDGFSKKMAFNNRTIEQLEQEIIKLQKNNKYMKKSMQQFLLELLSLGLDCRNTGLVWIIKKLQNYGEIINDRNFPTFLDSKARQFLLTKTKKITTLEKLTQQSHDQFGEYKKQMQPNLTDRSLSTIQNETIQQSLLTTTGNMSSFASINSQSIRLYNALQKKLSQNNEVQLLLNGVTTKEKKFIDKAFNQIATTKETPNDIVYKEAQKKIHTMFRNSQGASTKSNSSLLVPNEDLQLQKEKIINEYADLQKFIEQKEIKLQQFDEQELQRLIKEIDYKSYLQRFNVDALQLLAALFGYQRAERELIKNGMMKK